MKRNAKRQLILPKGTHVLDIPLDQILLDPNQPRTEFDADALAELAETIKSQGLQQYPTVNFAYEQDGKRYYYIKAGERRFRVHQILKRETMRCIVLEEAYDGTLDVNRKLAQAAENSSREPHTHAEIIAVMEAVVKDEYAKREGKSLHGAIEVAMGKVATAFGRSRSWAENYYNLTHLHPELRSMLDVKDDELRLNFNSALSLSRVPADAQHELLEQGKSLRAKGGHALMFQFISRQARIIREHRGNPMRGRKPSDDKVILTRTVKGLYRLAVNFCGERRSTEHQRHVSGVLSHLSIIEVDSLLHELNESLIAFQGLKTLAQEHRDALYQKQGLRVVAGS